MDVYIYIYIHVYVLYVYYALCILRWIACCPGGMCIHGKCICDEGWHGSGCQIKRCPNDCSGAGYCFHGASPVGRGWEVGVHSLQIPCKLAQ